MKSIRKINVADRIKRILKYFIMHLRHTHTQTLILLSGQMREEEEMWAHVALAALTDAMRSRLAQHVPPVNTTGLRQTRRAPARKPVSSMRRPRSFCK